MGKKYAVQYRLKHWLPYDWLYATPSTVKVFYTATTKRAHRMAFSSRQQAEKFKSAAAREAAINPKLCWDSVWRVVELEQSGIREP
jgi:hypothetical protein